MTTSFMREVTVNTVGAKPTADLPLILHSKVLRVRPVGSAGWMEQPENSLREGEMLTSWYLA